MKKAEEMDFKELEIMLSKYKWYLREAKRIELSIRFPTKQEEFDVGVRANTNNHDGMLRTLIKLEENEELSEYVGIGRAIEKTYAELPDYLQKTMKEFYIDRKGIYRGFPKRCAAKLNVDESTLYRWRGKIAEEFRINLHEFARVRPE